MLCQLRDYGFGLALDDLGIGYSSLSYLQRYPINRITIDPSFIAEGGETALQHSRLVLAGCTDMHGYLFSKPVSADEVDLLLVPSGKAVLVP